MNSQSLTFVTDATGHEVHMGHSNAAFHFARTGHVQDGTVWRASEIRGRHLSHRLTFTSYYLDARGTGHTMAFLLHHEMLALEATARWEEQLAHTHQLAAAAA